MSTTQSLIALRVAESLRGFAADARRPADIAEDLEGYLVRLADRLDAQASALEHAAAPVVAPERRLVAQGEDRLWRKS